MNALNPQEFSGLLFKNFPHQPTVMQQKTLDALANFTLSRSKGQLFLLKGYAGTGKTTIVGVLVKSLWHVKMSAVLLAPTGRAAKVMSNYSNTTAFTIHKKIYHPKKQRGGGVQFVLAPNKHRNTLFIVDEASMIPDAPSDSKLFANGSLLDDLIYFVYSGHNCKLVLIGDTAQLPPVKLALSPALEEEKLALNYDKEVTKIELDEVMRQANESGILLNATNLREQLDNTYYDSFKFELDGYTDIIRLIDGNDVQEAIDASYSENGKEETAFIVRSNKRANLYNENIRQRILFLENEISVGDYMMVVKNNYFWLNVDA